MKTKVDFLKEIKNNIEKYTFHITVVLQSESPRFAYTIGNLEKSNYELVFAGGANFLYDDILRIFNSIVPNIPKDFKQNEFSIKVEDCGVFRLIEVHKSWRELMMLGVYDYYNINDFAAYQIVPDEDHHTLDIPNMSKSWDSESIIWKWLDENIKWDLGVPQNSKVAVDLDVLLGKKIIEVTRWENNEWDAFSDDPEGLDENDFRIIPIATLIGIDNSTSPILKLDIEEGLWREDGDSDWNNLE